VNGDEGRVAELERRVEELRRVNERLGRELVEAEAGRRPATATPAARSVAKMVTERDRAEAELTELAELRSELERLWPENEALRAEVDRLRGGILGLSRRARARLSRP
jgi:molybdenum-dependent DNA-binding transcriptional regulator ModE